VATQTSSFRRLDYLGARRLVLAVGIAILAFISLMMYARGVETTEVAGSLLFIPVFVALVMWDVKGGLIAGLLAAAGYFLLRYPALRAVAEPRFVGAIVGRSIAFTVFGVVGGWANRQMGSSLTKLELFDQIDDATGMYNARFFLDDVDLELARSRRYQSMFSVVTVDVPAAALSDLPRRRRAAILRDLGKLLRKAVRVMDRPVHGTDADRHTIAVILPDTGEEGSTVLSERLGVAVAEYLRQRGAHLEATILPNSHLTMPGDEERLEAWRDRFRAIDRLERPPSAQAASGGAVTGTPKTPGTRS
jgi:hypothetical protein